MWILSVKSSKVTDKFILFSFSCLKISGSLFLGLSDGFLEEIAAGTTDGGSFTDVGVAHILHLAAHAFVAVYHGIPRRRKV